MKIKEEMYKFVFLIVYRKETLEKEKDDKDYDFKKIKSCSNIACYFYFKFEINIS